MGLSMWWRGFTHGNHRHEEMLIEGDQPALARGRPKGHPTLPLFLGKRKAGNLPATASASRSPSRANRDRGIPPAAGLTRRVPFRAVFPAGPGAVSPHNTNRPPDADA